MSLLKACSLLGLDFLAVLLLICNEDILLGNACSLKLCLQDETQILTHNLHEDGWLQAKIGKTSHSPMPGSVTSWQAASKVFECCSQPALYPILLYNYSSTFYPLTWWSFIPPTIYKPIRNKIILLLNVNSMLILVYIFI